jgi:hypothetical protein
MVRGQQSIMENKKEEDIDGASRQRQFSECGLKKTCFQRKAPFGVLSRSVNKTRSPEKSSGQAAQGFPVRRSGQCGITLKNSFHWSLSDR